MALYVVKFGTVKLAEDDWRKPGDVIDLEPTDTLVTMKHQVMTEDDQFQPMPVRPEETEQ
jgi:hypothetical protein